MNKKNNIENSVQIVNIHLQVDLFQKHISKPPHKSIEKLPKRTQLHIKRLTKKGFHIQNAIN